MDCIFIPNIKNDEFNEENLNNQKSLIIKEINDLHESPKEESIYKAYNECSEDSATVPDSGWQCEEPRPQQRGSLLGK